MANNIDRANLGVSQETAKSFHIETIECDPPALPPTSDNKQFLHKRKENKGKNFVNLPARLAPLILLVETVSRSTFLQIIS